MFTIVVQRRKNGLPNGNFNFLLTVLSIRLQLLWWTYCLDRLMNLGWGIVSLAFSKHKIIDWSSGEDGRRSAATHRHIFLRVLMQTPRDRRCWRVCVSDSSLGYASPSSLGQFADTNHTIRSGLWTIGRGRFFVGPL